MDVEAKLLQYALKSKSFVAELTTKTKEVYYPLNYRIPIKALFGFFEDYRDLPSYTAVCEYIDQKFAALPNKDAAKEVLQAAYDANKDDLVAGDFYFLIDELKKHYNAVYLKQNIRNLDEKLRVESDISKINEEVKKVYFDINALNASEIYAQGSLQDSAKDRWKLYNEMKANPELAKGIPSGFKDLDKITNGFKGSELVLVSGPTSSGKSVILMNMAINAWMGANTIETEAQNNSGHNVWFITIENPKSMMERRIDACISGVAYDHIRDGGWTEEEGQLLKKTLHFQHSYDKKFYVSDLGRGVSITAIEAQYEKLLPLFVPDMIVIDYLGIMKATDPTGQDWLDQGSIAADLHEFSRVINKPVLTASQMKSALRTPAGLKRFVGDPESVARSKMITDNVNINLQIKKDENFHISSYLELFVAKNRDGKTGDVIMLNKEFWRQRVSNVEGDLYVRPDAEEEF